jgi:hypothetical protein
MRRQLKKEAIDRMVATMVPGTSRQRIAHRKRLSCCGSSMRMSQRCRPKRMSGPETCKMAIEKRKAGTRGRKVVAGVEEYQPTDAELSIISSIIKHQKNVAPRVRAKVELSDGRLPHPLWDHPDQSISTAIWSAALGTHSLEFGETLFHQLARASRTGDSLTAWEINGLLAIVLGIGPRDEVEALLAAQMAAVHNATMVAARRLMHAEDNARQDSASTMFNKLARTFAAQVEALKKHRLKGEQTIKVQHVTVNEGGQAIVGNVQGGGGPPSEIEEQSHGPSAQTQGGPPLPGDLKTLTTPLPSASGKGKARVPVPRGARGRARGQG